MSGCGGSLGVEQPASAIPRHSGCSPIARVDNVYVMIRRGFEVRKRIRAQLIITKSAAELADWKKLDEIFCDGSLRVEEIQ